MHPGRPQRVRYRQLATSRSTALCGDRTRRPSKRTAMAGPRQSQQVGGAHHHPPRRGQGTRLGLDFCHRGPAELEPTRFRSSELAPSYRPPHQSASPDTLTLRAPSSQGRTATHPSTILVGARAPRQAMRRSHSGAQDFIETQAVGPPPAPHLLWPMYAGWPPPQHHPPKAPRRPRPAHPRHPVSPPTRRSLQSAFHQTPTPTLKTPSIITDTATRHSERHQRNQRWGPTRRRDAQPSHRQVPHRPQQPHQRAWRSRGSRLLHHFP